ncbi:MAG TPA: metallophosphoesterase family protein [bacterium]|nr:metallophosphoesterase family protein [bacterium]HPV65431.1 metallophosphoesterase family protein [bacterium]
MKIAIISDIHDNLANLGLFFEMIKTEEIKKIICCGDVCNQETLVFLSKNFKNEIFLVRGNMELYEDSEILKLENIDYLGRYGTIEIGGLRVGVCHEPIFINNLLENDPELKFIFYGHTHRPWISMRQKATLINPGTLGGVFQKACFAIWDTETTDVKLKIIQ